jgi:hypothetical protein
VDVCDKHPEVGQGRSSTARVHAWPSQRAPHVNLPFLSFSQKKCTMVGPHVRSALGRPGVRAGGGRASLTNLGVLVSYIRLSSPSAVGLRRRMRTTVPPVLYI